MKSNGAAVKQSSVDVSKLVEMTRGLLGPTQQTSQQILQELFELIDVRSQLKIKEYLRMKVVSSLRAQRATLDEAMRRYGAD